MLWLFFLLLFFPFQIFAANPGAVVINEIAWMGSPPEEGETASQAANDEWVELYNQSSAIVDLTGWTIKSRDGNPLIELSGGIAPGGYFLLSRANDAAGGVGADLVYPYNTKTSSLSNSGEHLELTDKLGNLIDDAGVWNMDWFAGSNETKQTMERKSPQLAGSDPANWANSANPGGTPRTQNSAFEAPIEAEAEPDPDPSPQPDQTSEPPPQERQEQEPALNQNSTTTENSERREEDNATSTPNLKKSPTPMPQSIFINELMPSPAGSDAEMEWIELINTSAQPADISFWKIEDTAGATNIYEFPQNTSISQSNFLVLSRPTAKIVLNNNGDGLKLTRPDGETAQIVNFDKAKKGWSFARKGSAWHWTEVPTPGSANIISAPPKPAPPPQTQSVKNANVSPRDPSINSGPTAKKNPADLASATTAAAAIPKEHTASIINSSRTSTTNNSDLLLFFSAGALALLLSAAIVLLKKRLN